MGVQIRIDVLTTIDATKDDIRMFLCSSTVEKPSVYVVVFENPNGTNPHFHIYVSTDDCQKNLNKIRSWWKTRHYIKDNLCVKRWGDTDDDMSYFYKGVSNDENADIMSTTHSVFEQKKFHDKYWEINKLFAHNKKAKESPNLVTMLVKACEEAGAKTHDEVVRVFLQSRVGLQGVCLYKHGAIVKSAWLHLNRDREDSLDYEVSKWVGKIFFD